MRTSNLLFATPTGTRFVKFCASPAREGFWEELKAFNDVHYAERFYGEIDFSADAG